MRKPGNSRQNERNERIRLLYEQGIRVGDIAQYTCVSPATVFRVVSPNRCKRSEITPEILKAIKSMSRKEMSVTYIAEKLNISPSTASKYKRKTVPDRRDLRYLTKDKIRAIRAARSAGLSIRETARSVGVSVGSIYKYC